MQGTALAFPLSAEWGAGMEPTQRGFSGPSAFLQATWTQTRLPPLSFSAGVCDEAGQGFRSWASLWTPVAVWVLPTWRTRVAVWVCPTQRTRVAVWVHPTRRTWVAVWVCPTWRTWVAVWVRPTRRTWVAVLACGSLRAASGSWPAHLEACSFTGSTLL